MADDEGRICCSAACITSPGTYEIQNKNTSSKLGSFSSTGSIPGFSGTVQFLDNNSGQMLFQESFTSTETIYLTIPAQILKQYVNSMAPIRVDITAANYENYSNTFNVAISKSRICCMECFGSSATNLIQLTPN